MGASREYNAFNGIAKRLYVEEKKDYIELSTELPVSIDTLRAWGKSEKWDSEREKYDTNPATIVRRLKRGLADMADKPIDSKTADAVHKLNKTIKDFEHEVEGHFLVRAIEVVERQKAYFEARFADNPDTRRHIAELLEEFVRYAEEEAE